jgi:MFS family permease
MGGVGAGLSVMVPIAFSAAGALSHIPPATSLSFVSALGYSGMLSGPPLIGGLSEWLGLNWALCVDGALLSAIAWLAIAFARNDPEPGTKDAMASESLAHLELAGSDRHIDYGKTYIRQQIRMLICYSLQGEWKALLRNDFDDLELGNFVASGIEGSAVFTEGFSNNSTITRHWRCFDK